MEKCFYCGKEIKNGDKYWIIAIDKPLVNLKLHKECDMEISKYGTDKYLNENKDKILEIINNDKMKGDIKRK